MDFLAFLKLYSQVIIWLMVAKFLDPLKPNNYFKKLKIQLLWATACNLIQFLSLELVYILMVSIKKKSSLCRIKMNKKKNLRNNK